MTKEQIVNRIASAITVAEKNGLSETRLALINIRSQIQQGSDAANMHQRIEAMEDLRLS